MDRPEQVFLIILLISLSSIPFLSLSPTSLLYPFIKLLSQFTSFIQLFVGALVLLIFIGAGIATWESLSKRFKKINPIRHNSNSIQTSSQNSIIPILILVTSLLIIAFLCISIYTKPNTKHLVVTPSPSYRPIESESTTESGKFQLFLALLALVGVLLSVTSIKEDFKTWKAER
ncbi:hypothetical protein CROQUDRAFT_651872, partial [Cronartium quercuum f. sp. fusiforme G11]